MVTVSEDQQSLAIGRGGQNVRLAAKLTGWNIDINSLGGASVGAADSDEVTGAQIERKLAKVLGVSAPGELAIAEAEEKIEKEEEEAESNPAKEAGVDSGESESIVMEEETVENTLPAQEETTMADEDNASISDSDDARDEVA